VFGIVKQLKGFIWVDSEPGQGTTFTIHFPVTEQRPSLRQPASHHAPMHVSGETILVVEDEESVRRFAVSVLRRHGYHVLEAGTPREALAFLEQRARTIHLMLTDVIMPEMTGPELVARLGPRPGFAVLFTSGYADPQKFDDNLRSRQDFLPKPFSAQQLLVRVRDVLAAST
jgi:CheY-like chemotaxis protein